MEFSKALELLKLGAKVRRHSWTATRYIKQFSPVDDEGKPTGKTEFAAKPDDQDYFLCAWVPNAESLIATDWEIVEPVPLKLDLGKTQRSGSNLVFRCNRNFALTTSNLNVIDYAVNEAFVKLVNEGKLNII